MKLIHDNALTALKDIDTVDCCITDPPYGSEIAGWDGKEPAFQRRWIREVMATLKKGGGLYFFFSPMHLHEVLPFINEHYRLMNIIRWHHSNSYGGGKNFGDDRWSSTWEAIVYVTHDGSDYNVQDNLISARGNSFDRIEVNVPTPREHPAQKPTGVVDPLLKASTHKGDTVLDPFMGSGTTGVQAKYLGRDFIGIDIREKWVKKARRRIRMTKTRPTLEGVL